MNHSPTTDAPDAMFGPLSSPRPGSVGSMPSTLKVEIPNPLLEALGLAEAVAVAVGVGVGVGVAFALALAPGPNPPVKVPVMCTELSASAPVAPATPLSFEMEVTSLAEMVVRPAAEVRWSWAKLCPAWALLDGVPLKRNPPPGPAVAALVTVRSVPTP